MKEREEGTRQELRYARDVAGNSARKYAKCSKELGSKVY